ncbi:hypothetical protein F5Y09DRAFT_350508 [Xylaria sp. FL1042]|nr:hypothetical protein F5Y09DRAFT_350508 [Xylaria sp. FL1042]
MSSRINTVLLIGATSGIGEALARRFHGMGRQVIVTGRNSDKLDALAAELEGLKTRQFDMSDLALLPSIVAQILHDYPELDTVFINGGIQKSCNLFEPLNTDRAEQIAHEITTNLTAPNILLIYLRRTFSNGVHAFTKAFRQQLSFAGEASKNMNIVEVVPPYVDTGLDQEHREYIVAMQGGEDKAFPSIALEEYINKFFEMLDQLTPEGSIEKEIAIGFGQMGVDLWRGTFGKRTIVANLTAALGQVGTIDSAEFNDAAGVVGLLPAIGALLEAPTQELWFVYNLVPIAEVLSMFLSLRGSTIPSKLGDYEDEPFSLGGPGHTGIVLNLSDTKVYDNVGGKNALGFKAGPKMN